MVATPKFHVTQDAARVFVHVHVPFVRVSDMEFYVNGVEFTFYCKPFLLKLHFPYEVVDDELAKAVYDPNKENGTIVVHLSKQVPGQDFPDLDMLTKLLQIHRPPVDITTNKQRQVPRIEVLNSSTSNSIETFQDEKKRLNALMDGKSLSPSVAPDSASVQHVHTDSSLLTLERSRPGDSSSLDLARDAAGSSSVRVTELAPSYGFHNAYSDFFRVWHGAVSEIVSLPDPESVRPEQRCILREKAEEEKFDVERYLLDVANQQDDEYFKLAMTFKPFWRKTPVLTSAHVIRKESSDVATCQRGQLDLDVNRMRDSLDNLSMKSAVDSATCTDSSVTFTDTEQELLLRLPRKEFLLPQESLDEKQVLGGLVDILIAFAYEHLTTQGDSGVESTWTVSIISPTLSWLDSNADLRAVVRSTVRRMITYPFLRQYDLAMRCVHEASAILKRGKRVVLRALLMLYRIIEKSETQYLLNSLYIQDYCVWIQSVTDGRLEQVSAELSVHVAAFTKSETGWALEELERSLVQVDSEHDDDPSSLSSDSEWYDESSSEEETSNEDTSEEDTDKVVNTQTRTGVMMP